MRFSAEEEIIVDYALHIKRQLGTDLVCIILIKSEGDSLRSSTGINKKWFKYSVIKDKSTLKYLRKYSRPIVSITMPKISAMIRMIAIESSTKDKNVNKISSYLSRVKIRS